MVGAQVLDDDGGDAGPARHVLEVLFERFKAACRST
jgi:hypothetical protein